MVKSQNSVLLREAWPYNYIDMHVSILRIRYAGGSIYLRKGAPLESTQFVEEVSGIVSPGSVRTCCTYSLQWKRARPYKSRVWACFLLNSMHMRDTLKELLNTVAGKPNFSPGSRRGEKVCIF